ncbi:unnamed protein product [Hermetia illucens]|uniref:Uncharacterized protein n=1 Tax=Hermetia illucens TaxID=343691 RepID=A0A7R8UZ86_HERIL|nr:uncharacterized protein LOC119657214 [Hermetia illucens]XP_037919953.1 uncharacterized protein LOC119657214 [Hermetia illucens]CAD7089742.1 unnamed protein product [Hermetia illucens]
MLRPLTARIEHRAGCEVINSVASWCTTLKQSLVGRSYVSAAPQGTADQRSNGADVGSTKHGAGDEVDAGKQVVIGPRGGNLMEDTDKGVGKDADMFALASQRPNGSSKALKRERQYFKSTCLGIPNFCWTTSLLSTADPISSFEVTRIQRFHSGITLGTRLDRARYAGYHSDGCKCSQCYGSKSLVRSMGYGGPGNEQNSGHDLGKLVGMVLQVTGRPPRVRRQVGAGGSACAGGNTRPVLRSSPKPLSARALAMQGYIVTRLIIDKIKDNIRHLEDEHACGEIRGHILDRIHEKKQAILSACERHRRYREHRRGCHRERQWEDD